MTNPKCNRRRGKNAERAVAKHLAGKRIGILGKEDIETDKFSVEVKSRGRFVAESWMTQAEKNCSQEKLPIVVVHITGRRHESDYVIMKLGNFLSFLKSGEKSD